MRDMILQEYCAEAAVEAGDTTLAKTLATALLEQNADSTAQNYGNIIHNANQLLGRVALREGNTSDAKLFLLRTGNIPGYPGGFYPMMFLARELLECGERTVVLEYLDLLKKYSLKSRMPDSSKRFGRRWFYSNEQIDQWKKDISEGKIPTARNWN